MTTRDSCHVADQHCTAAANHEGRYTTAVCVGCGEHTCRNCSVVVREAYPLWLVGRWCANCMQEGAKDSDAYGDHFRDLLVKYVKRWYKLSGYKINQWHAKSVAESWYGYPDMSTKICEYCKQEIK